LTDRRGCPVAISVFSGDTGVDRNAPDKTSLGPCGPREILFSGYVNFRLGLLTLIQSDSGPDR